GAGGDGEVRAQIQVPGELVLPIVAGIILFGVEAAPTGDVDREGIGAAVIRCGLDGEVAAARGGGEEGGGAPGAERAGALAVKVVGKESRVGGVCRHGTRGGPGDQGVHSDQQNAQQDTAQRTQGTCLSLQVARHAGQRRRDKTALRGSQWRPFWTRLEAVRNRLVCLTTCANLATDP